MSRKSNVLLGLLLFNGLSATAGGLALMTDWIPEQASWVRDTDFPRNYFPGVILMAVVGGSSLIAATALAKRSPGWQLASIVAGTMALLVTWTPARRQKRLHRLTRLEASEGDAVVRASAANLHSARPVQISHTNSRMP